MAAEDEEGVDQPAPGSLQSQPGHVLEEILYRRGVRVKDLDDATIGKLLLAGLDTEGVLDHIRQDHLEWAGLSVEDAVRIHTALHLQQSQRHVLEKILDRRGVRVKDLDKATIGKLLVAGLDTEGVLDLIRQDHLEWAGLSVEDAVHIYTAFHPPVTGLLKALEEQLSGVLSWWVPGGPVLARPSAGDPCAASSVIMHEVTMREGDSILRQQQFGDAEGCFIRKRKGGVR